jgi:aspartyl-tRNA(Asn)/glutamyl-tRNA(Gln) amidotransferase subunit C
VAVGGGYMIDPKTIENVAKLARLKLNQNEVLQYTEQLSKALMHFEEISKINTEGVEPLVTASDIETYLREDNKLNEIPTSEIVKNAPDRSGMLFKVPPVV